jgi:alpha-N-arabinofuranosidase
VEKVLASAPYGGEALELRAEARGQAYRFYWRAEGADAWQPLGGETDGTILSTDRAGGFTGAYMGMYAVCKSEAEARADAVASESGEGGASDGADGRAGSGADRAEASTIANRYADFDWFGYESLEEPGQRA